MPILYLPCQSFIFSCCNLDVFSPQAYFGGEARCDAEAGQGDDYDPRELICGACSDVSRAQVGKTLY